MNFKPRHILGFLATLIVAALSVACNTTGCTDNQNSIPLAGIYSYTTLEAIAIDSVAIGGSGAPNDSLLASPARVTGSVYLPFRAAENSATFYIDYCQTHLLGLRDEVTFYYESYPWFASDECGAMYHYRITRVTHTKELLDSVGVSDSLITNVERETIRLYFRTALPGDPEEDDSPEGGDPEEDDPDQPDTSDPSENPDIPTEGEDNV